MGQHSVSAKDENKPIAIPTENPLSQRAKQIFDPSTRLGLYSALKTYTNAGASQIRYYINSLAESLFKKNTNPTNEFSSMDPSASRFLNAAYTIIKAKYKWPPTESTSYNLLPSDLKKIRALAEEISARRQFTFSNTSGDRYEIIFPRDITQSERSKLTREIALWRRATEPYPIAKAFIRAEMLNLMPESITQTMPDSSRKKADPIFVLGKSMISGSARSLIYNTLGLTNEQLSILEKALSAKAKDLDFNAGKLFRSMPVEQRDRVLLVYTEVTAGKKPINGVFIAGIREWGAISLAIERDRQVAAYQQPITPAKWHIARISTTNIPGNNKEYYLVIPKSLLSDPAEFQRLAKALSGANRIVDPMEIALVFGFLNIGEVPKELFIQKRERGAFTPSNEDDLKFLSSGKLQGIKVAVWNGQSFGEPEKRKTGKAVG